MGGVVVQSHGNHRIVALVAHWLNVCTTQDEALLQGLGFESHLNHSTACPHLTFVVYIHWCIPNKAEIIILKGIFSNKPSLKMDFQYLPVLFDSVVRFFLLKSGYRLVVSHVN